MDEDEKELLNDYIAMFRAFCETQDNCNDCPFHKKICDSYNCTIPCNWEYLE